MSAQTIVNESPQTVPPSTDDQFTSQHLATTVMLDYQHPVLHTLIKQKAWAQLPTYQAIRAIYNFVRDDIKFGYNADDKLSASQVLKDGYGQCNTKGTLLMALLRAVNIPTRIHGFTIYNQLQKGAIPNYLFSFAPERILHSWVEVYFEGRWLNLEGYIIDKTYLNKIQHRFLLADQKPDQPQAFSGYGIATKCLKTPAIEWQGQDTYIQKEGIADDFGIFAQADDFYQQQGSNLSGIKRYLFRYLLRHLINFNVKRIRNTGL